MRIVPYLNFKGHAEEALNFYVKALGGQTSEVMRFENQEFPGITEEMKHWILHAEIRFKDDALYLSDTFEPANHLEGNNCTIHLDCDSEEELRRLFDALKEDAQYTTEPMDTFWGAIYGDLKDKFGIHWSFNYQKQS